MSSEKIYSSREQKIIGKSFSGYLKEHDGSIKLFVRCSGHLYREMSQELRLKIKGLLKKEGFLIEAANDKG